MIVWNVKQDWWKDWFKSLSKKGFWIPEWTRGQISCAWAEVASSAAVLAWCGLTCRHHVSSVAGDRQALPRASMVHEQRQASRVSREGAERVGGAERLAGHPDARLLSELKLPPGLHSPPWRRWPAPATASTPVWSTRCHVQVFISIPAVPLSSMLIPPVSPGCYRPRAELKGPIWTEKGGNLTLPLCSCVFVSSFLSQTHSHWMNWVQSVSTGSLWWGYTHSLCSTHSLLSHLCSKTFLWLCRWLSASGFSVRHHIVSWAFKKSVVVRVRNNVIWIMYCVFIQDLNTQGAMFIIQGAWGLSN